MSVLTTEVDQIYVYPHVVGRQELLKTPKKNPILILLLFVRLNQQNFLVFRMMYERWANECPTVSTATTGESKKSTSAKNNMPGHFLVQ